MAPDDVARKIHDFASAINVMCTKGSPVLAVLVSMRKYADDLAAGRLVQEYEQIGWIQEITAERKKVFYEGNLDPREVHDNLRPCYPVFAKSAQMKPRTHR